MNDRRVSAGWAVALGLGLAAGGCQWFVDDADREVYRLVEKRQVEAVGVAHDMRIDTEKVPIKIGETAREFVPHPVDSDLPASFKVAAVATAPAIPSVTLESEDGSTDADSALPPDGPNGSLSAPAPRPAVTDLNTPEPPAVASRPSESDDPAGSYLQLEADAEVLTLAEALAYAFEHARDFQDAKEDLYLAALSLTLERHLWTPRFSGDIRTQYVNYGQIRKFDQAMDAVARVAVEQRLPYGGEITAQLLGALMRDLTNHITTGETGQALLSANIPLLRGAGPVAYESRYRAERQLIYAIRTFERFRRFLAVSVASDYFELQQLRQQIINVRESIEGYDQLARRARAFWKAGRSTILDVQRAEQDQLNGTNQLIDAIERYLTALDLFKIRIGMPTATKIMVALPETVATQPAEGTAPAEDSASDRLIEDLAMPAVDEAEAVRVALKYRLDLLNELDRIGDAERGVEIAENAILPQLDVFGTVQFDTDPNYLGVFDFNSERTTWRTGATLELPLDRKAERNALRESLINKRRAERNYELARDTVVQQVRRAMRRVEQQRQLVQIQLVNRQLAQRRLRAAQFQFQKGMVAAFEVVDAQNDLLRAQNGLAGAQASLKVAILEFWRDTDMLRIDDNGEWNFELASADASR
ncbi:MAG TPA: TolC family protein [Phycisphaerae bacterium]|nr:TolC family protein [Phycisphaerae bacterium]HOJ75280.1 TolC family protein [Phycisphaerae bacterium]HOM53055.1 TolC family protein [Phycisphaerae bacterium]HON67383.1 TolC family protein [Phycisphaerae bacterium]HOQ87920.1 TolC family protein [Phycisphaerae bacterium]